MTTRDLPHRDAELIAAFLDKKLPDDDRQAFLERLDEDEGLYEVFVETVRYRDQRAGTGGELIEPAVWRKKWFLPAAAAAVIALVAVSIVLVRGGAEASYAEMLVADGRLEPYLTDGWYEQGWSEMRGAGARGDDAQVAVRLGVRVVDLEIALRSGRRADARRLVRRIEELLRELEFSEPLQQLYADFARRLEEDGPDTYLIEVAGAKEVRLREFLADLHSHYELGRLCELGKLAATSGDIDFFYEGSFAQQFDTFTAESWPNPADNEIEEIARTLRSNDEDIDFSTLKTSFASVLARF